MLIFVCTLLADNVLLSHTEWPLQQSLQIGEILWNKIHIRNRVVITLYEITKNNITRRALEKCGIEGIEVEGPLAIIIGHEEYLEPAKAIYEYTKEHDFYKIKGGVVEGKVMTAEEIITLAKLPSRETLIGMLAGGLLGTISKLAVALDQVRLQKEGAQA